MSRDDAQQQASAEADHAREHRDGGMSDAIARHHWVALLVVSSSAQWALAVDSGDRSGEQLDVVATEVNLLEQPESAAKRLMEQLVPGGRFELSGRLGRADCEAGPVVCDFFVAVTDDLEPAVGPLGGRSVRSLPLQKLMTNRSNSATLRHLVRVSKPWIESTLPSLHADTLV